ncbi:hypothetical protein Tco_1171641 [Tanacetum coccineum]
MSDLSTFETVSAFRQSMKVVRNVVLLYREVQMMLMAWMGWNADIKDCERLGYVLPQDLSVGLILHGLTSDFAGFVRNYNMHNMGKTISELHALLIEYENGLPKKAATPQVMAIQDGRIQKANKK